MFFKTELQQRKTKFAESVHRVCILERNNRSENMGQVLELLPSRTGKVIIQSKITERLYPPQLFP